MPADQVEEKTAISNEDRVNAWLKDGTDEKEPVTVETPSDEKTETKKEVTAEGEQKAEPTEQSKTEKKEEKKAGTETAEDAPKMFKGMLDGKEFEVPAGFTMPVKRGDEVEQVPIGEVQEGVMRHKDYSIKTQTVSDQRRVVEQKEAGFVARQAKLDARAKYIDEQEKRMQEAQADPEKHAAYLEHIAMYERNPEYREQVDKAIKVPELEAENTALKEASNQAAVDEGLVVAKGWIEEMAKDERFLTVDPERVRGIFANALMHEGVTFERSVVEQIFQQEATFAESVLERSPLRKELSDLTAKLDAITAAGEAKNHNDETEHAVKRAAAPDVRPSGSPAGTTETPRELILPEKREGAIRKWVRGE